MSRFRKRAHAEGEQDFELNITSIIDCFTVLIAFILTSASFISIGIIDADAFRNEIMKRRGVKPSPTWCVGPGKVTQALGIDLLHNNLSLSGKGIWIRDDGIEIDPKDIQVGPRIGVDYAGEDAKLPYRFWVGSEVFLR